MGNHAFHTREPSLCQGVFNIVLVLPICRRKTTEELKRWRTKEDKPQMRTCHYRKAALNMRVDGLPIPVHQHGTLIRKETQRVHTGIIPRRSPPTPCGC